MITIGLADDDPLFTAGLAMILDAHDDFTVVWQAIDGADALRHHDRQQPDVVLLDIRMPVLDGLAATEKLIDSGTGCKIIILTTFDSDEYVLTAVEAGAAGFLVKNTPPDDLVEAIRTVHNGDSVISPGPTRKLFASFRANPARSQVMLSQADIRAVAGLTDREQEVLALIADGRSNREICDQLWLSMPTVKTHVGNLLAKTGAHDRVQLVLFALRTELTAL